VKTRILGPDDGLHRIHTYFKGSPYHPDGERVLYTRFRSLRDDAASVCVLNRSTGEEAVLGESGFFTYHNGAGAWFCDGGNKVIFQAEGGQHGATTMPRRIVCVDLRTGKRKQYKGTICLYSGDLRDRFIEMDSEFPIEKQGKMGIYIRNIDGTGKKLLATLDDLLAANPQGSSIRGSGVRVRLGGEISPDQKKVILFLVTQIGTLVRDYYICGADGSNMVFHGRLGTHIMWAPNSRDILAFVRPTGCSYFPHLRGENTSWDYGLLASYDTHARRMEILSNYKIPGGCHVSPSPDGSKVVLDSLEVDRLGILLFDYKTGKMRRVVSEKRDLNVEPRDAKRLRGYTHGYKHYDVNAHPVFSRDSRRVLFNSCTDGRVRLREMEV